MASETLITGGAAPIWDAPGVHSFSVDDYHCLAASGVLSAEDRVELVDGCIFDMTPIGAPHAASVQKTLAALWKLPLSSSGRTWHVRVQQPLTLARSEPQPDLAIVRGTPDDYAARHPGANDVALVIEVADASLEFDRGRKLAAYAAEGIAEYWIVDLAHRRVELFASPTKGDGPQAAAYGESRIANLTDELSVVLDGQAVGTVRAMQLLV